MSNYKTVFFTLGILQIILGVFMLIPIIVQFFYYLFDVIRGDFGISLLNARPVSEDIARVFPATMELATLGVFIGIFDILPTDPLGMFSGLCTFCLPHPLGIFMGISTFCPPPP